MKRRAYPSLLFLMCVTVLLPSTTFAMLHPTMGRFLQRDPVGYAEGVTCYQYLRSNPLASLDPLGLASWLYYPNVLFEAMAWDQNTAKNVNADSITRKGRARGPVTVAGVSIEQDWGPAEVGAAAPERASEQRLKGDLAIVTHGTGVEGVWIIPGYLQKRPTQSIQWEDLKGTITGIRLIACESAGVAEDMAKGLGVKASGFKAGMDVGYEVAAADGAGQVKTGWSRKLTSVFDMAAAAPDKPFKQLIEEFKKNFDELKPDGCCFAYWDMYVKQEEIPFGPGQ